MKFKKIVLSVLIMITIISVNTQCSAKYVIEYNKKAFEIVINN